MVVADLDGPGAEEVAAGLGPVGVAARMDATLVRTRISRTVIDCNRDPSGASLYPGQATTELCPTTSFDGEPLYRGGAAPSLSSPETFSPSAKAES